MALAPKIQDVTARIVKRSADSRAQYLDRMRRAAEDGPRRAHLTCGNQAHAFAAMGAEKASLVEGISPNIGIVTAYNDMLSAHQPFQRFPDLIKQTALANGGTAQVAGGVPAMCDGVTQGQTGMELSLFSRDVIALAAGVALSHNTFDSAVYLGVCDKIVPGLIIAAATFGYIPSIFLPAGPMPSGLPNEEKSKVRQLHASGQVGRDKLMEAEMASYHGPGTCTFYGTANSNQMLMEFMGLHLPGASFVNPDTDLRDALTHAGAKRALEITNLGNDYRPVCDILDERTFVNGLVGLMATGGSTNLVIHIIAMARAAGVQLDLQDLSDISDATPLMARVYPNGLADVNHFHAAGGLTYMIGELLDAGLLHPDTVTVMGNGLQDYTQEPKLIDGEVRWQDAPRQSQNDRILRPASDPFAPQGGLKQLNGNLGRGVIKISAVADEHQLVEAPARVFHDQEEVKAAFKAGSLTDDCVIVVRFQGPKANGMPELHALNPLMAVMQGRGQKVALVTDGRMSGASGKTPAAIHVSPEALDGGLIAKVRDGDMIRLDAKAGTLQVLAEGIEDRAPATADLSGNTNGVGRELFAMFRANVGGADTGAAVVV
ncbi:phosphogluconate dehydratase [Sulfitobacter pseudonitzschiae]|uniref:Phosphogluconate dehydratase n=1 Tax=Pseudosulfitobacter pseudonitzschiae TaxID=1402135 RepID=A0A9Q2S042_9RHOB|nr:phosphogluconate dehydratase [Pseudosulfitobacter pseudonitzschiae]MBM2292193.1 phosphogluconate dehydratase [Pseudosulfitobacter pseudonitzschiae]MBM2297111.1 phosphogluconate dehydratase [Pseudosulfitobacter pseudonitzschiae]MBM2302025.1 phosphogluconate dehydratase [Pseudosulfitobacter pseudonitzschiae]MBM2311807.1 phosphogluconate dehydratase [Pseudosulfitobacter pseudonitzschiae]MBM2316721.1 phosphogluconate dehydratase [Pseudosulfitobacter pseudonitzschiae]|tara:strand:- start:1491 stop:3296 length:1806 start_codon:yes stop_codon:yes gene_type:complete